jgi:hypothetical protein
MIYKKVRSTTTTSLVSKGTTGNGMSLLSEQWEYSPLGGWQGVAQY